MVQSWKEKQEKGQNLAKITSRMAHHLQASDNISAENVPLSLE